MTAQGHDYRKKIEIAYKLYEARRVTKSLLGESYQEKMAEIGKVLTQVSQKTGESVLTVAQNVSKNILDGDGSPLAVAEILSAAIELIDPRA